MRITPYGYEHSNGYKDHPRGDIRTAQEHVFMGSTPSYELCKTPTDFYVPVGVLEVIMTIEEAIEARKREGYTNTNAFGSLDLHVGSHGMRGLAMLYKDLDPATGQTLEDPEFGQWDEENQKITMDPEGRNITEEFYDRVKKLPEDYAKGFNLIRETTPKTPEIEQSRMSGGEKL